MGRTPNAERQGTAAPADRAEWMPMVVFPRAHSSERDGYADARTCITRYLPRLGNIVLRGFALDELRLIHALSAQVLRDAAVAPWGQAGGLSLVHCRAPVDETSLVDLRELYRAVPAPARARLVDRGLRFVQRLAADHWPAVFATAHRGQVAASCAENGTSHEWLAEGQLRLWRSEPAVTRRGNDLVWNALTPRFVGVAGRELYQADGRPIERGLRADLEDALDCVRTAIAWEPGDLMVVDRTLSQPYDALEWGQMLGLSATRIAVDPRPLG